MPLNDVSNAAAAASTERTPYKADRFAGFVIPGLTAPAPVAAKTGNGKTGKAPARSKAVAATTTKRKAPAAAKKEAATAAAAAAAAAAAVAAEVAADVQPTSIVADARTPGTTACVSRAGAGKENGGGAVDGAEDDSEHTPEQHQLYGDEHGHLDDATTPAPLVMGETPLAAYLAPEGTPYAYPAAYDDPYGVDDDDNAAAEGRGFERGPATPYASAPFPEDALEVEDEEREAEEEHRQGEVCPEDDEAYDEPTMLIPSMFRTTTMSTTVATATAMATAAAAAAAPHPAYARDAAEFRLQEEEEEEAEAAVPSFIPHAKDSDATTGAGAGAAWAGAEAGGRCLSKEAAALLDGQEAVARALKEAEEAEVAVRAGGRKRSSRRATMAPSRYGEFLSWDSVKAIGTPGRGPKKDAADDHGNDGDDGAGEGSTGAGRGAKKRGGGDEDEDKDEDYEEEKSADDNGRSTRGGGSHHTHSNSHSISGSKSNSDCGAGAGAGRACGMGNGDNGMTCPIPSLRFAPHPASSDPTVQDVHEKVSALMRMAQDFLPLGEDEEDAEVKGGKRKGGKRGAKGAAAGKDDMEGKSLREALSDAWNGQSYYAKLAAQMNSPEPVGQEKGSTEQAVHPAVGCKDSFSSEAAAGAASAAAKKSLTAAASASASSGGVGHVGHAGGGAGGAAAGKKTAAAKASAGSRRKSIMPPSMSAVTRETASSLAKVSTRRKSLGGQAAAAIREALEKVELEKETSASSSAKKVSPKSKSPVAAAAGVATKKKRQSVGKAAEAALAALMAETTKQQPQPPQQPPQQQVGWMTQTNALFTDGNGDDAEERRLAPDPAVAPAPAAPAAPAAADNSAPLERQMALLRAELAMTRSDLESAQREAESLRAGRCQAESEAESLRAVVTSQAGQLRATQAEVESLRRELSAVKGGARAAVSRVATALRAQLAAGLDAVGMAEAEALEVLSAAGQQSS